MQIWSNIRFSIFKTTESGGNSLTGFLAQEGVEQIFQNIQFQTSDALYTSEWPQPIERYLLDLLKSAGISLAGVLWAKFSCH